MIRRATWAAGLIAAIILVSGAGALGRPLSVPARAAISQRVGRAAPQYWIHGLHGTGPGMAIAFSRSGMRVSTPRGWFGLQLAALQRGGVRALARTVMPIATRNIVSYRRPGMREWYLNGPAGLEQGFTIARRPVGGASSWLTLELRLSGTLRPTLAPGATGISLRDRHGRAAMTYGGLAVSDSGGRPVRARLGLSGGGHMLSIAIDDRGATYPLTVDPFTQAAGLTASGGAAGDALGTSVAMSGNTVVAGAPNANGGTGAAYVFVKSGANWATMTETATLTASDAAGGALFGDSVAIQGSTVVIGAPGAMIGGHPGQGAAYVFTKPGTGWGTATPAQAKLSDAAGAAGDALGTSVAIDGGTIVLGAPQASADAGAADVFVAPGSSWASSSTPRARLTSSAPVGGDLLGTSVAVSGDTVAVGAPQATVASHAQQGEVGLFVMPAAGWSSKTQDTWLISSVGATGDVLGTSVAMSGDTIVAGAPAVPGSGSALVFYRPDGDPPFAPTTTQVARLTISTPVLDQYLTGENVAIDGSTIVVGSPWWSPTTARQGAQFVYLEPAAGWHDATESQLLQPAGVAAGDHFGAAGISGQTIVGGSPVRTVGANPGQGEAYVFTQPGPASATSAAVASTSSFATLTGTVNPLGVDVTDCHFEYGTTHAYGLSTPCASLPGSGTSDVNVVATVFGLAPGTIYHYRLSATNAGGTHDGADMTFRTPGPAVTATGSATNVTAGAATLNATVNPNGSAVTDCLFDYGTTLDYGQSVPCAAFPGAGTQPVPVSAALSGLSPATTYHFRIVAANPMGTGVAADATFTTAAGSSSPPVGGGSSPPGGGGGSGPGATVPPPVNGRSVDVSPVGGRVTIKLPGAHGFQLLKAGEQIPLGATVDATNGRVRLTSASAAPSQEQTADFSEGAFVVTQKRSQTRVMLGLTGGRRCVRGRIATIAKHRPRRSLFGSGHGAFTTSGGSASASVSGTIWLTEDYCDGTRVAVFRGRVIVRDFVRRKAVIVTAGESYFASAKRSRS